MDKKRDNTTKLKEQMELGKFFLFAIIWIVGTILAISATGWWAILISFFLFGYLAELFGLNK